MSDEQEHAPLPSRRYTDKEVARILKDATEFQRTESTGEHPAGMSLAELEAVAREAGLDPALIRRAAASLDSRVSDDQPSAFLGAPRSLVLERTIEGEVPQEEFEVFALEIQRSLGGLGTASMFGRTMQWTSAPARRRGSMRVIQVTVAPRNGHTTIRIEEPLSHLAVATFVGSMGGVGMSVMPLVGVGTGALASTAMGPGAAVAVAVAGCATFMGATYGAARFLYKHIVRQRSDRLQDLMARLVEHASRTAV